MDAIGTLLHTHWGLRDASLEPLPSGHTNSSWRVHGGDEPLVLRVSWRRKSPGQVHREAAVLAHLDATPGQVIVPRYRRTRSGHDAARTHDGRWMHLFDHIEGTPGRPDDAVPGTRHAMQALARLHDVLATMDTDRPSPVGWLRERYERVRSRAVPRLPSGLGDDYLPVLEYIGDRLAIADAWAPGPAQWLHGDYHAGNVLFTGDRVNGVVDFDEVGQGARWLESVFAAFAFSRDATVETRFQVDRDLWTTALDAYAGRHPSIDTHAPRQRYDLLLSLFCAGQVLIHLEAAQRGLWTLGPGIGFLGCWHELNIQQQSHRLDRGVAPVAVTGAVVQA